MKTQLLSIAVLLGGAMSADGRAFTSFLELANAFSGGRIVGLTAASALPGESASFWRATFRQAGAARVEIPEFDRRSPAVDERVAAMVREAQGVFLGGGDQVTLVAALSGTRTATAIKDRYRDGGVVCGTSAGAAALSRLTMAGGEIDREGNLVAQYIGPGLGLLGYDAIIDTHFSQRRRLQRLFFVVAGNTELLGVGIDEDTALIVRGDVGEVVGAGGVQTRIPPATAKELARIADRVRERNLTIEDIVALPRDKEDAARFATELQAAHAAGAAVVRTVCMNGRRYEQFTRA